MDDLELECRRCGGVQRQEMVDVSTLSGGQDFLPGQWFPCDRCGYIGAPMEPAAPASCIGPVVLNPWPPTPEEIRRHALG